MDRMDAMGFMDELDQLTMGLMQVARHTPLRNHEPHPGIE